MAREFKGLDFVGTPGRYQSERLAHERGERV